MGLADIRNYELHHLQVVHKQSSVLPAAIREHLSKEETEEERDKAAAELSRLVRDLGYARIVSLRVNSLSGFLGEIHASKQWTGLQVRREIRRTLKIPIEEQDLV